MQKDNKTKQVKINTKKQSNKMKHNQRTQNKIKEKLNQQNKKSNKMINSPDILEIVFSNQILISWHHYSITFLTQHKR